MVAQALEATPYAVVVDDAVVAVSELVTNALVHAGTEIAVQICVDERGLLVEVHDGNPQVPVVRRHAREAGTGRGLHMVDGLADEWGVYHRGDGKVVWFRIGRAGDESSAPPAAGGQVDSDTVQVTLLDFPLLIHAAWQEHSTTLLREYLLVSLGDGDGEGDEAATFTRHVDATEALHLVADQAPALDLGDHPHRLMSHAVEPRVTASRFELTVPRSMLACFDVLDAMMDQAVSAADGDAMLVPPTQPEVREMRRWLLDQVRAQALTGAEPEPYAADLHHDLVAEPVVPAGWDTEEVSESDRALVAPNDTRQIIAVSRPAVTFLGHTPQDLVGRRVLTVIPPRFRQAHVAGMTLHMINGRSPLLEQEVTVPMLCADGTERLVRLEVRPTRARGERVFVGELLLG
jgi:PAS domain S-box-containing protein